MVRNYIRAHLAVTAVCASAADPLQLVDNPPDRHIVVRATRSRFGQIPEKRGGLESGR